MCRRHSGLLLLFRAQQRQSATRRCVVCCEERGGIGETYLCRIIIITFHEQRTRTKTAALTKEKKGNPHHTTPKQSDQARTTRTRGKTHRRTVLIPSPRIPSLTICPRCLSFRKSNDVERSQAIKPKKKPLQINQIKLFLKIVLFFSLKRPFRRDWLISSQRISRSARRALRH